MLAHVRVARVIFLYYTYMYNIKEISSADFRKKKLAIYIVYLEREHLQNLALITGRRSA